jgi:integral membrane protein
MTKYLNSLGLLRFVGFLEGSSLVLLVFIAVPLKYLAENPFLVKSIGPVHGALFLVYIVNAMKVAIEQGWKFSNTTWKVLIASLIPFGTFYIDHKILKRIQATDQ